MTKSAFFSLEYPGLIHGRYKYVLKVILNIIKRWPISLRTYVHRPTTNPLPYTTLFIQNISPFLIGLLSRKKTVNTKDIELWPITTNKTSCTQAGHKTTTVVECCFKFPTPDWLFPCNTITFQKYFRCLWFYEFHDKSPAKSPIFIRLGNSLNWWYKMYCNSKKGRRLEIIQKETKNQKFGWCIDKEWHIHSIVYEQATKKLI